MNINKKIFLHSSSIKLLIVIVLQQIIVAFSTFSIIKLAESTNNPKKILFWMIVFSISLIIVYIPTILSKIYLDKAKYDSFKKYIDLFNIKIGGKIQIFNSSDLKAKYQPYINNEGFTLISNIFDFFSDWISLILNSIFNIFVLVLALNKLFLVVYIIIIPLFIIIIKVNKSTIKTKAKEQQKYKIDFFNHLLKCWDTILIGNFINVNEWIESFEIKNNKALKSKIRITVHVEIVTIILMCLSLIPILGVNFYLIYKNLNDYSFIVALIATMPRQVSILQYINQILVYWNNLIVIKTRFFEMIHIFNIKDFNQYIGSIKFNEINIIDDNIYKINDFNELIMIIEKKLIIELLLKVKMVQENLA